MKVANARDGGVNNFHEDDSDGESAKELDKQFVFLGGGATIPVSDYGDYADTGFLVTGGGALAR